MLYESCTICKNGQLDQSEEIGLVRSNVRKFKNEQFTVWRCHSCRSLHCKEDVDLDYYYKHYPLSSQKTQYLTRVSYQNRLKILKQFGLSSRMSILDYGCGEGLFLEYVRSKGYKDSVGFDPYIQSQSDRTTLESKYDFVYSFGVIEHVTDPKVFFEEQAALVQDIGRLVIATPCSDGLEVNTPNHLLFHQPYHRHILSSKALEQLAEESELQIIDRLNRNWLDTLHPGLNSKFIAEYIKSTGGFVDCLFEKKSITHFLKHPSLWKSFWLGYFHQADDYMIYTFGHKT